MAEYVVTPGSVLASLGATKSSGKAGATITAGEVLARDTDGTYKPHDANAAAPLQTVVGVALHGSLTGQPIQLVTSDPNFQPGFALVAGDVIIASATTPGSMCPEADKAAGWFVTVMGVAISTTAMKLDIVASGVAKA